jgi:hypothetical protein
MARVPVVDPTATRPIDGINARATPVTDADAFGFGVGQSLQKFGQTGIAVGAKGLDIATDMQTKYDESVVKKLDLEYSLKLEDLRQKHLSTRGQAAIDGLKDSKAELDKLRKEYEPQLQNERQKRLFGKVADARYLKEVQVFDSHSRRELDRFTDDTSAARVENFVSQVNKDASDKSAVVNIESIRAELRNRAARNGWDAEKLKQEENKVLERTHANIIITRSNNKDPKGAKAWFDAHKDSFSPVVRKRLEGIVDESDLRDRNQKIAIEYLDGLDKGKYKNITEVLADVDKKYEGKQLDDLRQRLKLRHAERERYQSEEEKRKAKDAFKRSIDPILRTGKMREPTPEDKVHMTHAQRLIVDRENLRIAKGKQRFSNMDYKIKLYQLPPEKFAELNMNDPEVVANLSDSDRLAEVKRQNAVKKSLQDGTKFDAASYQQQIKNTITNVLKLDPKSSSDKAKIAKYYEGAYDALYKEQSEQKRKLSQNERQKVLDRLVLEKVGTLYGASSQRYYEVRGTDEGTRFLYKTYVPDTFTQAIQKDWAQLKVKGSVNSDHKLSPTVVRMMYLITKGVPDADILKAYPIITPEAFAKIKKLVNLANQPHQSKTKKAIDDGKTF